MKLDESHEPTKPSGLHPRSSTERIEALDILRGFAIFGILILN